MERGPVRLMEYHAHIYWKDAVERKQAMAIREWLYDYNFQLGRVWDQLVGPHTRPMYQVIYDSSTKDLIEKFLDVNKQDMSVLLHESINDDLRDHTDGARWLGEPLELNLGVFENEKT